MGLGLSGVVPALHYILTEGILRSLHALCCLVLMALIYLCGGAIYALRIPERLWPGKFDIMVSFIMFHKSSQELCRTQMYRSQDGSIECSCNALLSVSQPSDYAHLCHGSINGRFPRNLPACEIQAEALALRRSPATVTH